MSKSVVVMAIAFLVSLINMGCSQQKPVFVPVDEFPRFDAIERSQITHTSSSFQNMAHGGKVTVIHSLENTSFHLYNAAAFETEKKGVLVGGTGLRIRSTLDGGKTWKEMRLVGFADAFHSAAFSNGAAFVVGEGPYIIKSDTTLSDWSVFDISSLEGLKETPKAKLYKLKFKDDVGFAMGMAYGLGQVKTCILKTTDDGATWQSVEPKGFQSQDAEITDFELLSENVLFCTTATGHAYKSENGGTNWKKIFEPEESGYPLNSIAFKNKKTGFIGGPRGVLFSTNNGGDNWKPIVFTDKQKELNIADIKYLNNDLSAITTAQSFLDEERPVFSYLLDGRGEEKYRPLLTKNDSTIYFEGDSYHLFLLNDKKLFLTDRNAVYKLDIKNLQLK